MFVLDAEPTFRAKVRFRSPGMADGTAHEFTAVFKRLLLDEMEALMRRVIDARGPDADIARELLAGWGDDLRAADGSLVPYTPENLDQLLRHPGAASAIVAAYRKAHEDAALGN